MIMDQYSIPGFRIFSFVPLVSFVVKGLQSAIGNENAGPGEGEGSGPALLRWFSAHYA